MRHGSLFSGIGGFDLAAEWMGWENVFHCEWNEFGQKVLKYYWPNAISYADITKTDFTIHKGNIDVLTGGFPCQPYSTAGKRKGTEDSRHLWPEMLRAIREIQPTWVVGENVSGLVNWNGGLVFDQVQADLEAEGYEVIPILLPACGVNAPHRRERVWFVAYRTDARVKGMRSERENSIHGYEIITNPDKLNGNISGLRTSEIPQFETSGILENITTYAKPTGLERENRKRVGKSIQPTEHVTSNADSNQRCERRLHQTEPKAAERYFSTRNARSYERGTWDNFPTQSPIRSGDDGFSERLDGITFPKWRNESIKAYGNAIVPQVAYEIFKVINTMNGPQDK